MRKHIAALAAALLLAVGFPAMGAADSWKIPELQSVPANATQVEIGEYGAFEPMSARTVISEATSSGNYRGWYCDEGLGSGKCDLVANPTWRFGGNSLLAYCSSASQENCIEGISLSTSTGTPVEAKFIRTVNTKILKAIPEQNLFEGSSVQLFEVSDFRSKGGYTTYAASVVAQIVFDSKTKKFKTSAINAGVYPYRLQTGSFSAPENTLFTYPDGSTKTTRNGDPRCQWQEAGSCGIKDDFAPGTRVSLKFRAPSEITGWFRGRLKSPEFSIEKFSTTNNRIVATAESVSVPRFAAMATKDNTTESEQALISASGGMGTNNPNFTGNKTVGPFSHWGDFAWLDTFRDIAKDTAAGESDIWGFSTIETKGRGNFCLSDTTRVIGVVTTNATMYNGVVPDFIDGQLTYKVGGLHYAPDGKTLNEGTYDLVMRSDVARCLYGFSTAPVQASIQVIGDGGETKLATTIINEKDGWIKLAAYGFSYSTPTVKITLTQPVTKKKTTITCVKGKVTKKVAAVGPKCPAGYKKK